MVKSQNRIKRVKRIAIFGLICVLVDGCILYSYSNTWGQIAAKKKEKEGLVVELDKLKEENSDLESTSQKLQDPEYIARYAREKRLYSGKNEYIIKIK